MKANCGFTLNCGTHTISLYSCAMPLSLWRNHTLSRFILLSHIFTIETNEYFSCFIFFSLSHLLVIYIYLNVCVMIKLYRSYRLWVMAYANGVEFCNSYWNYAGCDKIGKMNAVFCSLLFALIVIIFIQSFGKNK